jgi:hypothetical protein
MKYIIKAENGYYSENPINSSIKNIVTDINEAKIIEVIIELTEEIIQNDFDLQWRLDTAKRIGMIEPKFVKIKLMEIN